MTGKTFKRQVIWTISLVVAVSGFSLWASVCWRAYADALRVAPTILISIGGAWLAFCWQRRVAFTKALFDIWQKIVVAVQDAIQYTFLQDRK